MLVAIDAGKGRPRHFADARVVVNADDGDFVRYGKSGVCAGVNDLLRNCVACGKHADRTGQGGQGASDRSLDSDDAACMRMTDDGAALSVYLQCVDERGTPGGIPMLRRRGGHIDKRRAAKRQEFPGGEFGYGVLVVRSPVGIARELRGIAVEEDCRDAVEKACGEVVVVDDAAVWLPEPEQFRRLRISRRGVDCLHVAL